MNTSKISTIRDDTNKHTEENPRTITFHIPQEDLPTVSALPLHTQKQCTAWGPLGGLPSLSLTIEASECTLGEVSRQPSDASTPAITSRNALMHGIRHNELILYYFVTHLFKQQLPQLFWPKHNYWICRKNMVLSLWTQCTYIHTNVAVLSFLLTNYFKRHRRYATVC